MDLRQLASVMAVADHHSFSAAARALHTVQSNVSTHVARLERELDMALVDRADGSLTPTGELVVSRARRVQAELDALAADVASATDEIAGEVRVGVIGTVGRWLVPLLLPAVARAHPRISAIVVDATTTSLLPQLVEGRLDLAVVNLPVADPDLDTETLFLEDRVLVTPPDHPLATGSGNLTIGELAPHRVLIEPRGTAFRDELDAEVAAAGFELTPMAEVDGMRLLATLAFEGYGPAVLPATAVPVDDAFRSWRRRDISDLRGRSVGVAVRRRGMLSAPARAIRAALSNVVETEVRDHPGVHAP